MIDAEDERLTAEINRLQTAVYAAREARHVRRAARWGLKPGIIIVPKLGKYVGKRCLVEYIETNHMTSNTDRPYLSVFVELSDGTFSKSQVNIYSGYDVQDEGRVVPLEVRKTLE